jgi:hypothetical protein
MASATPATAVMVSATPENVARVVVASVAITNILAGTIADLRQTVSADSIAAHR